ncbi:hypothetical protein V1279_006605 [Bradyrhizobium sp. AZCC 1610]|uniref:hypothetical protein n=1 Tax=Bradyrhizobium sp. AZCC 1610 TaxID=3117020 RepID=UPI002FEEBD33
MNSQFPVNSAVGADWGSDGNALWFWPRAWEHWIANKKMNARAKETGNSARASEKRLPSVDLARWVVAFAVIVG